MSNSGAVTAALAVGEDVNGKAEMESAAAAAVSDPPTTKCKKKKKRKQEVANAEEGVTVVQEAAPVGVAVLALEGTPISKKKKEKVKGREMVEQEATTAAVPGMCAHSDPCHLSQRCLHGLRAGRLLKGIPKSKKKKEKAKEQEIVELEATTAAVSAAEEGTQKCKKKKKKAKEAANAEESGTVEPEVASVVAAAVSALDGTQKSKKKKKEKANEQEMMEPEATTTAVSAEEGTLKCKTKKRKAKEVANSEESRTVEQESASVAAVAVSALEGTPKSKKKKKEKAKEQEAVEQEATTAAVSAADEGAPKCKKEVAKDAVNAEENGMVEHEAASVAAAAVSALEGTPKSKKKKKKEKAKERETVEQEATTAAVSAADEGTPKCKKKKKEKARGIVEQGPTTAAVSALEGTPSCKENEEKVEERGMAEQDATTAAVLALEGALKCKKKKNKKKEKIKETGSDELELSAAISAFEGTQKYQNKEKGNEAGLAKQETTTEVSASERTSKFKKKLKKKNKMQEQDESPQALSSPEVDKILASKPGNGCTNGEGASVDADVSMVPINGEDPNCSEVKDTNEEVKYKAGEENKDCSENCSSLLEISEDRKRPKRKRKQDRSNRGPGIPSQDGDRVVKRCMDSSMEHDLSCVCASCLVLAHKEKVTNIYSPRGSLIRFQRKKLLILDLNGLLADINMDYRNSHRAHAKVKAKLVFKRPYCDDFLRFCFQNFELGIWSSRLKDNVNSVVNILMRDLKQYLLFCWDMSHCTVTGRKTVENKHKPLVLKELKKLWNKEYPNLPWEQGEFSPSNTLLVDDSPYKALCNPPHTAIFPQPYSYLNEKSDYSLGPGGDLRVYLERLAAADDVQVFVRENPFGQPSIMESDPHWNFYAQIVDKVEKSLA
ncbi:hypothetical protein EJB05_51723 [Eragrostis curvula]|uniref:FCP1 homology domain-containing protein n=1 Tax=Eragrostis curvula TaxID=38414 RepID=A0A5J9SUR2_9POAL|nr:hypothetical protein EJB05_51723 [Eragrostis curvula]